MSEERFEREIKFRPAFDNRSDDPSKNYGVGALKMTWLLKGELGVIQFVVSTGWYLPEVEAEWDSSELARSREPDAWDIGYHSPTPHYEDQPKMDCDLFPQGFCYYDGSSLSAEPILQALLCEGHEAVWSRMEDWYRRTFKPEIEATGSNLRTATGPEESTSE